MCLVMYFFFFNDTATTEIYTLSLHDALPISSTTPPTPHSPRPSRPGKSARPLRSSRAPSAAGSRGRRSTWTRGTTPWARRWGRETCYESEEHTSELQSQSNLVCRLLLEKKKQY